MSKPKSLPQDLAELLVKAVQQETKAKHGKAVHTAVTAFHVRFEKRLYIVSLCESGVSISG